MWIVHPVVTEPPQNAPSIYTHSSPHTGQDFMYTSAKASSALEFSISELAMLQEEFPGFDIWLTEKGLLTSFVARRRHSDLHPHTLVTSNPHEMRMQLQQNPVREDLR